MKRLLLIPFLIFWGCAQKNVNEKDNINCSFVKSYNQIHVLADGKHFTTLLYDTTLTLPIGKPLMKPILYPLYSPSGVRMQRQYPLKIVPGESHDHPHHQGVFFAYGGHGEVNGNNFWTDQEGEMRISQAEITEMKTNEGKAILKTRNNWVGAEGKVVLVEERKMVFSASESQRIIDFTFVLKAQDEEVVFEDSKEGLLAIRVADWLSEEHGNGMYLNSKGDTTSKNVWGKRAKWVRLEGHRNDKDIGIIIMNHQSSVNYPAFWMARGYGLFAANPLGQFVYQKVTGVKNPEPLNYTIAAGDSALFKFRMIVYEGHRGLDQINKAFKEYNSL